MRPNPGRLRAGQFEHAFLGGEMDTAHRSARPGMKREVQGDAAVLDDLSTARRTMYSLSKFEIVVNPKLICDRSEAVGQMAFA